VFTPVLAKHTKSFNLIDTLSVGVDRIQRNFEPMRQVETWRPPIPRTASFHRKPEPRCAAGMDLKFRATRSTVLQIELGSGFRLLNAQPVAVTCTMSLFFHSAMPYLTIFFIGTGLGARSVSSDGG